MKLFEDGEVVRPLFFFDGGHVGLEAKVRDVMGLFWLLFEFHASLERGFVGFFEVAFTTAGDEVFPCVGTAAPTRDNVVEGEVAG